MCEKIAKTVRRSAKSTKRDFHYVYIIRSKKDCSDLYIGMTSDLRKRLADHNEQRVRYTKGLAPWELVYYSAFPSRELAREFETYLKSHSGRAFLRKRLISPD
ncbi:MAG: GIY-YIG nuclease family protein [Verrucomicrobiota bacterium]